MPNKLSQFWQELKRRNVVRVITVYAGATFVIIELINNITEPLHLPEWTPTLVIVLLAIGFPVVIIFSWIYDIHPEGGLVKTEPPDKVKAEDYSKSSNGWKVATYISFVVIVALIVLNAIPRNRRERVSEILDKSIAVLPFHNDSPDQENNYFINGTMESILNNLCKIRDLRVISRSSVEQFRDSTVYIPDIAEFLNTSYILEGSMQKYDNHIRITLQLIDCNDRHVWSEQYDREILTPEEHFSLQSEIAELVAGALQAAITPDEKELIEKVPTTNAMAYEFYQKGMDELGKINLFTARMESLKSAETLFRYALDYDSTLALAYAGLARVYAELARREEESFFSEDFMDTVLILADKALSLDHQLSDAYSIKGDYYRERGQAEQALQSYDRAIELNPNDWSAYSGKAVLYYNDDLLKIIDNLTKVVSRYHGPDLPSTLYTLGYSYYAAGIMDKGDSIFKETIKVSGDSGLYLISLNTKDYILGNYEKIIERDEKMVFQDTSLINPMFTLGIIYARAGQFENAVKLFDKTISYFESSGQWLLNDTHRVGYAYWMNGDKEKGAYYLNLQKEYCEEAIRLGRRWAALLYLNYDLAGVYAFQGERDKAYENLRILNQRDKMPQWMVSLIKRDPLFDNIREEPEFQQIVRDVEAKYQAEHERVRQWLEQNDML